MEPISATRLMKGKVLSPSLSHSRPLILTLNKYKPSHLNMSWSPSCSRVKINAAKCYQSKTDSAKWRQRNLQADPPISMARTCLRVLSYTIKIAVKTAVPMSSSFSCFAACAIGSWGWGFLFPLIKTPKSHQFSRTAFMPL